MSLEKTRRNFATNATFRIKFFTKPLHLPLLHVAFVKPQGPPRTSASSLRSDFDELRLRRAQSSRRIELRVEDSRVADGVCLWGRMLPSHVRFLPRDSARRRAT